MIVIDEIKLAKEKNNVHLSSTDAKKWTSSIQFLIPGSCSDVLAGCPKLCVVVFFCVPLVEG